MTICSFANSSLCLHSQVLPDRAHPSHVSLRGWPAARSKPTSSTRAGWAEGEERENGDTFIGCFLTKREGLPSVTVNSASALEFKKSSSVPAAHMPQVALGRSLLVSEAFFEKSAGLCGSSGLYPRATRSTISGPAHPTAIEARSRPQSTQ